MPPSLSAWLPACHGSAAALQVQLHVDYPMWLVLGTQSLTFGGGLLGITYGALSASWDASREGSAWGWTEFKANTAVLMSKEKQ